MRQQRDLTLSRAQRAQSPESMLFEGGTCRLSPTCIRESLLKNIDAGGGGKIQILLIFENAFLLLKKISVS